MNILHWKFFKYSDVFDIKKGKRLTIADQEKGNIQYISSSSANNGVDNYISNGYTDENCISFASYGSIGEVFYHNERVWISDNANVIYLKGKAFNVYIALFIVSILNKEKYRFSYGVTGKKERLNKLVIKLPIDDNDTPNWDFMESYIKELILKLPQRTKSIWFKSFNPQPLSNNRLQLNTENWKWFELNELFYYERGVRLTQPDRQRGNIPLVTAGEADEGVADYISNEDMIRYHDRITIDMFGNCFYREYVFCCDDNILVLQAKNKELSKYQSIFIATIINKDIYKCAYGRQYRQKTFVQHNIKLPATKDGVPDWQFMEDYIKGLPYSSCL